MKYRAMRGDMGCFGWFFALFAANIFLGLNRWAPPGLNGPLLAAMLMLNVSAVKALRFRTAHGRAERVARVRRWNRLILFIYCVCFWIACKWAWDLIVPYWDHMRAVLADPFPLNAMEGRETVKAWLMAQGRNIYPAMDGHPFLVTIYPPGYHAAIAALSVFLGWDIASARIVSVIAFAGLCLVMWLAVAASTRSVLAACALFLITLFDPVLSEWSLHARPDMLAWALAMAGAGLFWGSVAAARKRTALALASGVAFCLALYVKQQTLPWLIGCLAWAAFKGGAGRRSAVTAALCCLGLGAALAGGMELLSGGNFLRDVALYPKLMGALPGVSSTENLLVRLGQVWDAYKPLWLLFAAYLGFAAWKRRWDLPLVLAAVNATFMVKLLASWGADINYAFGTVLAALLCVGLLAGAAARSRPYGAALAFALLFAWLPWPSGRTAPPSHDISALEQLSGRILVNTEGGQLFTGTRPGRDVTFFDGIETQLYEQTGLWSSGGSALVRDIRARKFDRLVFFGGFMPQAVADAASVFYAPAGKVGHYSVLAPARDSLTAALLPHGEAVVAGGRAVLADISTLAAETEGLTPASRDRPGFLRLAVESPEELRWVEAELTLRIDPKDTAAGAFVRMEDGQGGVLAEAAAPRDGRSEVRLRAAGAGKTAALVVELRGRAWVETSRGALAILRGGR